MEAPSSRRRRHALLASDHTLGALLSSWRLLAAVVWTTVRLAATEGATVAGHLEVGRLIGGCAVLPLLLLPRANRRGVKGQACAEALALALCALGE